MSWRDVLRRLHAACFCVVLAGGCATPHVTMLRAECERVPPRGELESIVFTSSLEARGYAGQQLLYQVELVDFRSNPIRSHNGRYENAVGNVAAGKSLMVSTSPWSDQRVRVSIPAQELEVRPKDIPVWAEFGVYLPNGTCLARELAMVPMRSPPYQGRKQVAPREEAAEEGNRVAARGRFGAWAAAAIDWARRAAVEQQKLTDGRPTTRVTWYSIRPGDTLSSIACDHYGAERYWTAIHRANPDIDPQRPCAGDAIVLPSRDEVLERDIGVKEREDDESDEVTREGADG